jgi:hypothetical protein
MKGQRGKREKEFQVKKKYINDHSTISTAFLIYLLAWLNLIFDHEDGSNVLLRNVALHPRYTAL